MLGKKQYPNPAILLQKMQPALSGAIVEIAIKNDQKNRLRLSAKKVRFSNAFRSRKMIVMPMARKIMLVKNKICEKTFIETSPPSYQKLSQDRERNMKMSHCSSRTCHLDQAYTTKNVSTYYHVEFTLKRIYFQMFQ